MKNIDICLLLACIIFIFAGTYAIWHSYVSENYFFEAEKAGLVIWTGKTPRCPRPDEIFKRLAEYYAVHPDELEAINFSPRLKISLRLEK